MLAASGLSSTPLISYVVLFFGTAPVLHILGSSVRNITKGIPLLGPVDTLLGGAIGFVEAWVVWLVCLIILGSFLRGIQSSLLPTASIVHGLDIHVKLLKRCLEFYNHASHNDR